MQTLPYRILGNATSNDTLFFIHGWPDHYNIFAHILEEFKDKKCICILLPNFGKKSGEPVDSKVLSSSFDNTWGLDFPEMIALLAETVKTVSPNKPVSLVVHDWGCQYGYFLQSQHPHLIEDMVAFDIGPRLKPNFWETLLIITYQFYLIFAFLLGGWIGDKMTQFFARLFRAPLGHTRVRSAMNFPYYYLYRHYFRNMKMSSQFKYKEGGVPLLYFYSTLSPVRFCTEKVITTLEARQDAHCEGVHGHHWFLKHAKHGPICANKMRKFFDNYHAFATVGNAKL